MSFSEFTKTDFEVIARNYAGLKESAIKRCADSEELAVVQKAFEFANAAHRNVRRRSGEPYILHPIAVAKVVVDTIGLGYKSITAALLHDVVEDTDITAEDIRHLFGDKIASLVDGLTKIKHILDNQDRKRGRNAADESLQAENLKRILLTMNDDVRVVLIKLADRLHNCRTIEYMPEHKRDKILSETMFIFIPLAHRLGLYEVKSEMENIWLRYNEPDTYNEISEKINRNISDKERQIDEFIAPIKEALDKYGIDFRILKRVKTPYSIWNKMKSKHLQFEQIYDLYAVRIIFNPHTTDMEEERNRCFEIFSIITGIYRYKPDRVRDWVKHPKNNGYEALHCTLMSHTGIWVEVQIRTKRMDDIAERGIAAHWAYKKDGYLAENHSEMDKWLSKVQDILVNPDVNTLELLDLIHHDLTCQDITVFTPKGDQKAIQKGATALDFAYLIHTEIGRRAIAAKVNLRLEPLSYTLQMGDQVEIITAENEHPKREWLQFLKTHYAIGKVTDYFRTYTKEVTAHGRRKIEEDLQEEGLCYDGRFCGRIAAALGIAGTGELLFRYGLGEVSTEKVMEAIRAEKERKSRRKADKKGNRTTTYIIDAPDDPHHYVFCSHCHPIPGDPVVGFLAPDGSITVHGKTCELAEDMAAKHGNRIVVPQWDTRRAGAFRVRIVIKGIDRKGLLNEITECISLHMGMNMHKIDLGTNGEIFEGYIDLMVQDKDALASTISQLKEIRGVQSVMRTIVE